MNGLTQIAEDDRLITTLLVVMFFVSGIHKSLNYEKTVENVSKRVNVSQGLAKLGTILVILLEIAAPLVIVYSLFTNEYKDYAYYSAISLVLFTVAVTVLYHPPDFSNYYKSVPFWANVSLIGGLLLLAKNLK